MNARTGDITMFPVSVTSGGTTYAIRALAVGRSWIYAASGCGGNECNVVVRLRDDLVVIDQTPGVRWDLDVNDHQLLRLCARLGGKPPSVGYWSIQGSLYAAANVRNAGVAVSSCRTGLTTRIADGPGKTYFAYRESMSGWAIGASLVSWGAGNPRNDVAVVWDARTHQRRFWRYKGGGSEPQAVVHTRYGVFVVPDELDPAAVSYTHLTLPTRG